MTRPAPRYPRQVNFQMRDDQIDRIDRAAHLGAESRAEIIRQCIDEAIAVVTERARAKARMRGRRWSAVKS